MKYAAEMGSGAMIYVPSFMKSGSGNQKLIGAGEGIHRLTAWRSHESILICQDKKIRLKKLNPLRLLQFKRMFIMVFISLQTVTATAAGQ
jgi:hypothetical protein